MVVVVLAALLAVVVVLVVIVVIVVVVVVVFWYFGMCMQRIYNFISLSIIKLFSSGEVAEVNVDISLLQIQYIMQCILQEKQK
jgi:hypothetical protein